MRVVLETLMLTRRVVLTRLTLSGRVVLKRLMLSSDACGNWGKGRPIKSPNTLS